VSCLPFPASRVLPDPTPDGTLIVDAHYASPAPAAGRQTRGSSSALRWLFHQAVPSFEIFTGLEVPRPDARKIWEAFTELEPRPKPHIALVGFMGTGKTTTGRELARLGGSDFVDTDELVEAEAGESVPAIFERLGESSFRSLERAVIERIASSGGSPKVISVGGGAVLDKSNREALARACHVVWLWAPARTALSRVEVGSRPVLDPGRPLESAERTLAARLPLYASAADLIINATVGDPPQVARRIRDEMG
jgi:shikimate kinase